MARKGRHLKGAVLALGLSFALATSAIAAPLPSSVTILTRDDFTARHWFSLAEALDQAASIDVARTGYRETRAIARLRGASDPRALLFCLDGRPVDHLFDGAVDLSQIPLNMIDRIEITRGGASVLYGPAAAGVVNIVTSRPFRRGLAVDLGTDVGRHGVKESNGRFLSRTNYGDATYTGGIETTGGFLENEGTDLTSHFGNFTRPFKKGGYWGGDLLWVGSQQGTPHGTAVPFEDWDGLKERTPIDPSSLMRQNTQMYRLLGASPKVGGGTFYGELSRATHETEILPADNTPRTSDQENFSTDARLRFHHKDADIGLEMEDRTRHLTGDTRRTSTRSAAYVTNRYIASGVAFVPGLRWDRDSRLGGAGTARLAVIAPVFERLTASASAQRSARFPSFLEEFTAGAPPANLSPERADSVDGGLTYEIPRAKISVTGFSMRVDNAVGADPAGTLTNGARDRVDGVEAGLLVDIGRGPWGQNRLDLHGTLQHATRREAGGAMTGRAPLSPRQIGGATLRTLLPWKLTLSNEVRYEAEQFELTGAGGRKLPAFAVWNARLNARIWAADLFVAVDNLLGRRYAEALSDAPPPATLSPQTGRSFFAGITIRFLD